MLIKESGFTLEDRVAAMEEDIKNIEERIIGIHDILIKMIEKNIKDEDEDEDKNPKYKLGTPFRLFKK